MIIKRRCILKIILTSLITFSLLFGILGPIFPSSSPIIEDINIRSNHDKLEISVRSTGPINYKVINMSDPYICLIVELYPAQLDKKAKISKDINKESIKRVRSGQFSDNPDVVRLIVDLSQPVKYEAVLSSDKCGLSLQLDSTKEVVKVKEDLKGKAAASASANDTKESIKSNEKSQIKTASLPAPSVIIEKKEPETGKPVKSVVLKTEAKNTSNISENKELNKIEPNKPKEKSQFNTVSLPILPVAVQPVAVQPVVKQPVAEKPVAKQPVTVQPVAEKKETVKIKPQTEELKTNLLVKKEPEAGKPEQGKKDTIATSSPILPAVCEKNAKVIQVPVKKIEIPKNFEKDYPLPQPKSLLSKRQITQNSKSTMYDLEYDNEDITIILKDITQKSGKNIFVDSSVKGNLTISVKGNTLERALQLVLKSTGFSYKIIGNIIIISTSEKLAQITPATLQKTAPETIQVISITATSAEQVKKGISDFMPGAPPITIDKRLNALVVRAPESIIDQIKLLVKQLDQLPPPPSDPQTKTEVFRFNNAQAKDNLKTLENWNPNVKLILDDRINAIIAIGSQGALDKLKDFINKIDAPRRQVVLDVKIIDITESGSKALGVMWNNNSGNIISTTFQEVTHTGALWSAGGVPTWPYTLPTYVDLPFTTFARSPLTLTMTLQYLVSKGEAKIIATPKVVTLSGEKANLNIGQHFPITYNDPRAGVLQAEYVDIAIILNVTPVITPDGFIMLDVAPEINELTTSIAGSAIPQTVTRSLKTNVIVKNNDTIILAGLYRRDLTTTTSRIPFLGDIPIFGEFFKNKNESTSKLELLLMITPRILAQ